jgi:hypothetical protein
MLVLAALLAAAQPAAASERELLDAFKAACGRTGDLAAMKADAVAGGWQPVADDADPRIERLNRIGRESAPADGRVEGASFRRTVEGRDLFLIVSRYDDESGFWGVGCRLYDFTAATPLDATALEAWMGRPPTGVEEPDPGLQRRLWEPGWRDGITIEASHVPQGHALGQTYGLSGNILLAQAIGGF